MNIYPIRPKAVTEKCVKTVLKCEIHDILKMILCKSVSLNGPSVHLLYIKIHC
jgi:hypothetical protein